MTDKPAILLADRLLAQLQPLLEETYTVYCLWEGPPVEASDSIRALIVAGGQPMMPNLLDGLPALGLIACLSVGYDGFDVADARRRGLQLSHAPGVNDEDVADHALGLLLASRRDIVLGDRDLRAGGWSGASRPLSRSSRSQKTGIVGLGAIGEALAIRCEVLGMAVSWWGPRDKPDKPWPRAESLLALARDSDNLVLCAPLDDSSRGMITAEVIEALGPRGLLINVARGGLVDEDALIAALKDGRLGAAALDVFVEEPAPAERWADVPHTVLTPHTGGATNRSVILMVDLLRQNLAAFFAGQPLKTPIPD